MKKSLNTFGKKIKKRLIDLNMTQAELAEMLGTSSVYLCRIISGERSGKKYREEIIKILKMDSVA